MHAHAIAQVETPAVGVHLMWAGPRPWVYSPTGWSIQRRKARPSRSEQLCDGLDGARITQIRAERVLILTLGEITLSHRSAPVAIAPGAMIDTLGASECEVFTLELDQPHPWVRVDVGAKFSFAFVCREGKVVASATAPSTGAATFQFKAFGIDTVVVYTLAPSSLRFCVAGRGTDDWDRDPYIVKGLQLPLRELMPTLTGPDDEFAEASARLLPGEVLDREEFERLTASLRPLVRTAGPPRPLDLVLLLREELAADFEELAALDPIRVLLGHPKWRRVLGFGWFDRDPDLVVGETYEYRITAAFPAADLADPVYGFHTVPSQTALPAELYLHDLRLRLPQPTRVERTPGTPTTGLARITRRGIPLRQQDQFFWLQPALGEWSAVIDFPTPVGSVVLELAEGHALEYAAGEPDSAFLALAAAPPGPRPRLTFSPPITQLRLNGDGFLHAVRIPASAPGMTPLSLNLPPVTLLDTPRPEPPLLVEAANLQVSSPALTSDLPPAAPPPRHALGFEVRWRPAPLGGLAGWPPDEPPPQLDAALYQIEHRESGGTVWTPVLPEENWTLGDRDNAIDDTAPYPGADLMLLFPEVRQPGPGLDCFWRDVFDFAEGDADVRRPVPAPGSSHQYRVRAVDPVGRPSLTWRESGPVRLEKRVPPPVPVGPEETPADAVALPTPLGVHARVLVRDAPDLTAADRVVLGDDDNAVVLRWGWHQQQRDQDPFAREFRVYVAGQLDAVPGRLVGVTPTVPGTYDITLELDRPVAADAAKGLRLNAGRSFRIESHTAGSVITATVKVHSPGPNGQVPAPTAGPVLLPLRLTPDLTRAPAWSKRVEVRPVTAAVAYETVIRNRLTLTAEHPRDTLWVGVSAADDQFYVPDPLVPDETRPGNESAVVPVPATGRYHGRPLFDVPPELDPVPVVIGPEPSDRPMRMDLDLGPFLIGSGLGPGDRIRVERAAADAVFGACFATADGRVMGRVLDRLDDGEVELEIPVPNPGDRAAIVAALESGRIDALEDRFVVFLAGSHPYRDRLFTAVTRGSIPFASVPETLPSKPARYAYRVRKSDAAGHLSAGGAMASVIIRVPSPAPPAAPEKLTGEPSDPPGVLRLMLPDDAELTHVLTFRQVTANGASAGGGELLRVPNRPDLYPDNGIRLRAADGELLDAQVKSLADPDVTSGDGVRVVELSVTAGAGERVRVWACSLSRDGFPSRLAGPWGLSMPVAPLPVPTLTVSGPASAPDFQWTWPPGPRYTAALERSADGVAWTRVSPLFGEAVASHRHVPPAGAWRYRLLVRSPDGRTSPSNDVVP